MSTSSDSSDSSDSEDDYKLQQALKDDYDKLNTLAEASAGDEVWEVIQAANALKEKHKGHRRALIKDAPIMKQLAIKKSKHIKKLTQGENGITLEEIQQELAKYVDRHKEEDDDFFENVFGTFHALAVDPNAVPNLRNIGALGRIGLRRCRIARGASHLIGAVEKERPPRKKGARKPDPNPGKMVVAETLRADQVDNSKNNTQTYGGIMQRKLSEEYNFRKKQGEVLPLLQALLDPRSFESTVQNMFVFSTLVASGMAKVSEHEDQTPIIDMCSKEETTELVNDRDSRCPIVVELDYEMYETLLDAYEMRDEAPLLDLKVGSDGLNAE